MSNSTAGGACSRVVRYLVGYFGHLVLLGGLGSGLELFFLRLQLHLQLHDLLAPVFQVGEKLLLPHLEFYNHLSLGMNLRLANKQSDAGVDAYCQRRMFVQRDFAQTPQVTCALAVASSVPLALRLSGLNANPLLERERRPKAASLSLISRAIISSRVCTT